MKKINPLLLGLPKTEHFATELKVLDSEPNEACALPPKLPGGMTMFAIYSGSMSFKSNHAPRIGMIFQGCPPHEGGPGSWY